MLEFILDKSNYLLSNYHQSISRKPYPFQEKAFLALDKLKSNNPNGLMIVRKQVITFIQNKLKHFTNPISVYFY